MIYLPENKMKIAKPRYPGVYPFEKDQSGIFFGRDKEILTILRRIESSKIVTVHGKSGTGKSSLIKAGVFPEFEERYSSDEKIIYLFEIHFGYASHEKPASPISLIDKLNTLINSACPTLKPNFLDKLVSIRSSIWLELKIIQYCFGKENHFLPILFVDQFEEVFSYPEEWTVDLLIQLAELYSGVPPKEVENSVERTLSLYPELEKEFKENNILDFLLEPFDLRIISTIRSDRFDKLDRIKKFFPEIMRNTYELTSLDWNGAEDAIRKPAVQQGDFIIKPFDYDDACVNDILRYLVRKSIDKRIEAFQLQLFCQYIEEFIFEHKKKTGQDISKIQRENLPEDLDSVNRNFYQNVLDNFDINDQEKIRVFIEEKMVVDTRAEKRKTSLDPSLALEGLERQQILLDQLVESKLIREVRTGTGTFVYEISHDALIEPILSAKRERLENDEYQNRKRIFAKARELTNNAIELLKKENYKAAEETFQQIISLLESIAHTEKEQAEILLKMGSLFLTQWHKDYSGNYKDWSVLKKSETYLRDGLALADLSTDGFSKGLANEKIGILYQLQAGRNPDLKKPMAINHYEKALRLYTQGNFVSKSGEVLEQLAELYDDPEIKNAKLKQAREDYLIDGDYISVIRTESAIKNIEFKKPWGYLINLRNRQTFPLKKYEYFIGRTTYHAQAEISFASKFVSRKHMIINREHSVEDTRSLNGTSLNANPMQYGLSEKITEGDIITLANLIPLQFFNEYPTDIIKKKVSEKSWGLFITENSHRYLTETNYVIGTEIFDDENGEQNIKLGVSENEIANGQFFIRKETSPGKALIKITDGVWTEVVFSYRETNIATDNRTSIIKKNIWAECMSCPYTCVLADEQDGIKFGLSFQILFLDEEI